MKAGAAPGEGSEGRGRKTRCGNPFWPNVHRRREGKTLASSVARGRATQAEFRTVFPWICGRRIARLDAGLSREFWKYRKCKTWLWGMRKVGMRGRLRTKICERQPSTAASSIFYFSKTRVRITIKDEEISGERGVLERRDFGQKLEVDRGRTRMRGNRGTSSGLVAKLQSG